MPKYAILASFTPESWAAMVNNPSDRTAAVRKAAEAAGGKLESLHFMFGEHDALVILAAPDAASQAAISIAVASSGAFSSFSTRELIEPGDLPGILAKAKQVAASYSPPGT